MKWKLIDARIRAELITKDWRTFVMDHNKAWIEKPSLTFFVLLQTPNWINWEPDVDSSRMLAIMQIPLGSKSCLEIAWFKVIQQRLSLQPDNLCNWW